MKLFNGSKQVSLSDSFGSQLNRRSPRREEGVQSLSDDGRSLFANRESKEDLHYLFAS